MFCHEKRSSVLKLRSKMTIPLLDEGEEPMREQYQLAAAF